MTTDSLRPPQALRSLDPALPAKRAFDATAMYVYPRLARLAGYRFEVGTTRRLAAAARDVLRAAWQARGVSLPVDDAGFGAKYDAATTWIVAFHGDRPVGVMGLMDVRVACHTLDLMNRRLPEHLDAATTREIARLAILPGHRGGARWVMVGLLREMLAWSHAQGVVTLLASSTPQLFRVYERYNPSARLVDPPLRAEAESPESRAYFAPLRAVGARESAIYTFEVAGASPWSVFARFLEGLLRAGRR